MCSLLIWPFTFESQFFTVWQKRDGPRRGDGDLKEAEGCKNGGNVSRWGRYTPWPNGQGSIPKISRSQIIQDFAMGSQRELALWLCKVIIFKRYIVTIISLKNNIIFNLTKHDFKITLKITFQDLPIWELQPNEETRFGGMQRVKRGWRRSHCRHVRHDTRQRWSQTSFQLLEGKERKAFGWTSGNYDSLESFPTMPALNSIEN